LKFLFGFLLFIIFGGFFGLSNSMSEAVVGNLLLNSPTLNNYNNNNTNNTTKLYVEQSYKPAARSNFTSRDQWRNR